MKYTETDVKFWHGNVKDANSGDILSTLVRCVVSSLFLNPLKIHIAWTLSYLFVNFKSLLFKVTVLQIQMFVNISHTSIYMSQLSIQKFILLFLLIGFSSSAFNQVITGTVVDVETKETIPFATIYFGGTFVGTSADQKGNFKIDISEYTSMPLKISAIGYYTYTLIEHRSNEQSVVYLNPKVYEIDEALVKTKSLARQRKRNLRLFRVVFIGSTTNAENCVIRNEEDITFNYGSDRDTLKAYARKPIQIENRSLGYNVTYYLDKFEYYRHSRALFFSGEIVFNKDLYIEERNMSFLINREDAYFGSRMHFIRALWANSINQNKYVITDSRKLLLDNGSIVHWSNMGDKYLSYPEQLLVGYNQERYSEINFLQEQVYFDESGYFDPAGIRWHGDLGRLRIADWLPFDYSVGIK